MFTKLILMTAALTPLAFLHSEQLQPITAILGSSGEVPASNLTSLLLIALGLVKAQINITTSPTHHCHT